jgi:hypothetical protein
VQVPVLAALEGRVSEWQASNGQRMVSKTWIVQSYIKLRSIQPSTKTAVYESTHGGVGRGSNPPYSIGKTIKMTLFFKKYLQIFSLIKILFYLCHQKYNNYELFAITGRL